MAVRMTTPHRQTAVAGFSLVELLIAIVVSSIMMVAVYTTYTRQQRVYTAQDNVVEVQQNLRAALAVMAYDFRMAAYDPQETDSFSVTTATATNFAFTADFDGNGLVGAGETLSYQLNGTNLQRTAAGGALAENITNIEFCYLVSGSAACTTAPTASQLDSLTEVSVSLLARAATPDPDYTDNNTYTTASGAQWGPAGDNYRRRFVTMTVKLRNVGS